MLDGALPGGIGWDAPKGGAGLDFLAEPVLRDRVPIGVEGDEAINVDASASQLVRIRDPQGQGLQGCAFESEELTGPGTAGADIALVDLVTPLPGLGIEVFEISEGSTGEEIVLDE